MDNFKHGSIHSIFFHFDPILRFDTRATFSQTPRDKLFLRNSRLHFYQGLDEHSIYLRSNLHLKTNDIVLRIGSPMVGDCQTTVTLDIVSTLQLIVFQNHGLHLLLQCLKLKLSFFGELLFEIHWFCFTSKLGFSGTLGFVLINLYQISFPSITTCLIFSAKESIKKPPCCGVLRSRTSHFSYCIGNLIIEKCYKFLITTLLAFRPPGSPKLLNSFFL